MHSIARSITKPIKLMKPSAFSAFNQKHILVDKSTSNYKIFGVLWSPVGKLTIWLVYQKSELFFSTNQYFLHLIPRNPFPSFLI